MTVPAQRNHFIKGHSRGPFVHFRIEIYIKPPNMGLREREIGEQSTHDFSQHPSIPTQRLDAAKLPSCN